MLLARIEDIYVIALKMRVYDVISHDSFPFPESSILGCDVTFSMLLTRIEDIYVK